MRPGTEFGTVLRRLAVPVASRFQDFQEKPLNSVRGLAKLSPRVISSIGLSLGLFRNWFVTSDTSG
jgi:hypothetical protein